MSVSLSLGFRQAIGDWEENEMMGFLALAAEESLDLSREGAVK